MNKLVLANGIGACIAARHETPVKHSAQYVTGSTANGGPNTLDGYNDWQYNDSWVLLNKNIEGKVADQNRPVGGFRGAGLSVADAAQTDGIQQSWDARNHMEYYAHNFGEWAGLRHGLSDAIWNLKRWEEVAAESEFYDMGNAPASGVDPSAQGPTPKALTSASELPKNIWLRYETRNDNTRTLTDATRQNKWTAKSVYFKETTLWHVRKAKRNSPSDNDLVHQNQNGWDYHNWQNMNGHHNHGDINKDEWCPVIGMFDVDGYSLGIVLNTSAQRNKYLGWDADTKDLCNASQNASKALRHLMTSGAAAGHYNNNGQAEDWKYDETTGKWSKVAVSKDGAKKDAKDGKAKKKEEGCCGCSCCCCVVIISLIVLAAAGVVLVLCCCCKKNQDDDSL